MREIEYIEDWEEARVCWDMFCPQEGIYDEWNFREHFIDFEAKAKALFPVIRDSGKVVAAIPFQHVTHGDTEFWEFVGGDYMEENRIFYHPDYADCVPILIDHALDEEADLGYMIADHSYILQKAGLDPSFRLPIDGYTTNDEIVARLAPKGDRSLIRKLLNTPFEIRENHDADLEKLITMSVERFGEGSWFAEEYICKAFRSLLSSEYKTHILSVLVDGQPESVSFGIHHKNNYYFLLSASNNELIRGFSKLHIGLLIKHAAKIGVDVLCTGVGDCGWKDRWHFPTMPLYSCDADSQELFTAVKKDSLTVSC